MGLGGVVDERDERVVVLDQACEARRGALVGPVEVRDEADEVVVVRDLPRSLESPVQHAGSRLGLFDNTSSLPRD